MSRSMERALWWGLGTAGTLITFLFAYRFTLHHFVTGPYLMDAGWFSYAMFQNGFELPNPPQVRAAAGPSLFSIHLYGLMSVLSPLSHAFSTHYAYFSTAIGAAFALLFIGPFLAVRAMPQPFGSAGLRPVIALGVGLLFVFSGPVVQALGYPHFEVAIPACFMLFLALHLLGWHRGKWLALLPGLLVREDAGLHCLGYAAVIALYQWRWPPGPFPRATLVRLMGLCLGVSLGMIVLQRLLYPAGESLFHQAYVGDPPFAHLTAAGLAARLSELGRDAPQLYVPALLVLGAAVALRAPALALGYLACVPWVLLNVGLGVRPAAQTLSLYYGFPLLLGLAWPLFAPHWVALPGRRSLATRAGVPLVALASLLSVLLLGDRRFPLTGALAGGSLDTARFERLSRCLEDEFRRMPGLYADSAVVALFPASVPAERLSFVDRAPHSDAVDGFIFFVDGSARRYEELGRELGLTHRATIISPFMRMVSREASPLESCVGPPF